MRLCVLGSGSKGNSILVESGRTRVLFDAGFSCRELKRRLHSLDVDPSSISAVVISHEHTDHIQGLRVLRKELPVYATAGTLGRIRGRFELSAGAETITAGELVRIGDLCFRAIPLSHDAAEPVGFVIENGGARAGILTDQGALTRLLAHQLSGLDVLVIEANHDPETLMNGPYQWHLKQRIKGRHGHLGNPEAAELVRRVMHPGLRQVMLAHLSEINNRPELARAAVIEVLDGSGVGLTVCEQSAPAKPMCFGV